MAVTVTLTAKSGALDGKEFRFEGRRKIVIGRGDDCDIFLPGGLEFIYASRHHCVITVAGSEVRVRDLGSRNGTWLNGMQIGRPVAWHLSGLAAAMPFWEYDLSDADELKVGETVFVVEIMSSTRHGRQKVKAVAELQNYCLSL
jgi:pSer/pThr/pTyr-binding forkhead associated (FHA) protein